MGQLEVDEASVLVVFGPLRIQRTEGLIILVFALLVFGSTGVSWWWFGGLLLFPDISMIGYLVNPSTGAAVYNAGHTLVGPALLYGWYLLDGPLLAIAVGTIWLAHIGMDRLLGYGLKYRDDFRHTHLGRIGPKTSPPEM